MQKKCALIVTVSILLTLITLSCDFQLPEKLTIRTKPKIEASAGTVEFKLNDYFNAEKIKGFMGDGLSEKLIIKEYTIPTDVMTFAVRYPLADVSIDFSEYTAKMEEALNNLSVEESANQKAEFTIPEINPEISVNQNLDTSFISDLLADIKDFEVSLAEFGTEVALSNETSYMGYSLPAIKVEMKDDEDNILLDYIKFGQSSTINIEFSKLTGASANYEVTLTNLELRDNEGNTICQTACNNSITGETGASIVVDVSNAKIETESKLYMTATVRGGTLGTFPKAQMKLDFSGAKIAELCGFDCTVDPISFNQTVPLGDTGSDLFKSATIGDGDLILDVAIPGFAQWEGINCSLNLNITQTEGINLSGVYPIVGTTVTIPLDDQTINLNDITFGCTANFEIVNDRAGGHPSKIILPDLDTFDIGVSGSLSISNISSAVVKLSEELAGNLEQSIEVAVPEDLKQWIKYISFDEFGVEFETEYKLPAGNSIEIRTVSTAFEIDNTLSPLVFEGTGETKTETKKIEATDFTFYPFDHTYFDFNIKINLPGYNKAEGTLTVNNLKLGDKITFEIKSITPKVVWNKVSVCPKNAGNVSGKFPQEDADPIDLSVIKDFLGEELGFGDIAANLYMSSGVLKQLSKNISGSIYATYDENNVELYKTPDGETLDFVDALVIPETEKWTTALPAPSVALTGLSDVLNAKPADLRLAYNLAVEDIEISRSDIYNDDGSSKYTAENPAKIIADIVLLLPLEIKTLVEGKSVYEVDLSPKIYGDADPRGDLLKRTEPTDIGMNLDDYVKDYSVALIVTYENNMGISCSGEIDNGTGKAFTKKEFQIKKSNETERLALTKDEIEYILNTVPFSPDIKLKLTDGVKIPPSSKNPRIKISIALSAAAKVDTTFDWGSGSSGEQGE